MAGDWIKMRCNLASDPAVIGIAERTDLDEDTVVGKLHRLWSWADEQTKDGNAPNVTEKWIDRFLSVSGFAKAMIAVGWLTIRTNGICFPRFDRHNGQTGKVRALTAKRVAACKERKSNADTVSGALPREEKRREENNTPPLPPGGGNRGRAVDSLDPLFVPFWKAYPKHDAKLDAQRAWDELQVDDALLEEMLKAIAAQKQTDKWKRGVIPNAGNWLRQQRWTDKGIVGHDDAETPEQRAARQQKEREARQVKGQAVPLGDVLKRAQQNQQRKVNDDPTSGS